VHATPQTAEQARFSKVELTAQVLASRHAKKQLLRIPWGRFRTAYEEYPRWLALSLWSRTIIATQGRAPSELLETIRERCPGFLDKHKSLSDPHLLAFGLLEWVHNTVFACAKRQGWLDALTFYGVRHIGAQAVWAFWERCENERNRAAPKTVPHFEEWRQRALETKICGAVTYSDMALAVEEYINWEATAQWVHPLLASGVTLPAQVVSELKRRLPRASCRLESTPAEGRSVHWRSVIRAAKQHCLRDVTAEGCADGLMELIRSCPRHIRLMVYGRYWTKMQTRNQLQPYPTFRQWQLVANHYTKR